MLQSFCTFFKENNLDTRQTHFLVAVSGGIDSVVLCHLCKDAGLHFSIAHCNFGLRGEESVRDEQFVRTLGEKLATTVYVTRFDTIGYAEAQRISIQEAARDLRYRWFEELRATHGFAYTLLAHHADDNIETLLMLFFRGTGLQGLTGMPIKSDSDRHILRPLLQVRRKEIYNYATSHTLSWVEDSSNVSSKYTRNFFRNELLPQIREVYPQAEENLLQNIERFKKISGLYQLAVQGLKEKICEPHGSEVRIPVLKLLQYQHTSLVYEIIKDYGFGEKQVPEVLKLLAADSGRYIQNEHYQVIRHRRWLIIAPKVEAAETIVIDKGVDKVRFGGGWLEIKMIPKEKFRFDPSATIAQLDANAIQFPLLLRRWKVGDYFYPLGMQKKKKLSRFFIDQKLSRTDKENVWVLESHKRIAWVVGKRIDDRFKVVGNSQLILQVSWTSL